MNATPLSLGFVGPQAGQAGWLEPNRAALRRDDNLVKLPASGDRRDGAGRRFTARLAVDPCGSDQHLLPGLQLLGDVATFRTRFGAAANGVFGSGWAFVTVSREGRLAIVTRPNQDNPLFDGSRVLMGNDVWEHAYYLRYQNRRAEYSTNWWNVLDWAKIGTRYDAARAGTLTI